MFGRVKKWLGIEGVKLELVLPDTFDKESGILNGKIRFTSKNEQIVTGIKVVMIEKYIRGRRKEKKIDEYELGEVNLSRRILVPAEKSIEIDFTLPFLISKSDVDLLEDRNLLLRNVARTAKWIRGVQSEFRIEAVAKVSGVALDPFDRKEIYPE